MYTLNIVYQKIIARNNQVFGYEALSRFYNNGELLNTYKTIKELEESNQMIEVGDLIVEKVLKGLERDPYLNFVLINLSAKQLEDPDAVKNILDKIKLNNQSDKIGLEILEDYVDYKNPVIVENLKLLDESGCVIAIDDFGTNAASLERLFIPSSIVKVDRVFLDLDKRYVLDTLPDLIHKSGKMALIEGIETEEQFEYCKKLGFDYFQGYFFDDIRRFGDSSV